MSMTPGLIEKLNSIPHDQRPDFVSAASKAGVLTWHGDEAAIAAWVEAYDFKPAVLAQIKAERDERLLAAPPVEFDGNLYDGDRRSQRIIEGLENAVTKLNWRPPAGWTFRDAGNVDRALSAVQIKALHAIVVGTVIAFEDAIYKRSWAMKAEVEAMTDWRQVRQYQTAWD